jgi:hypothetical protein
VFLSGAIFHIFKRGRKAEEAQVKLTFSSFDCNLTQITEIRIEVLKGFPQTFLELFNINFPSNRCSTIVKSASVMKLKSDNTGGCCHRILTRNLLNCFDTAKTRLQHKFHASGLLSIHLTFSLRHIFREDPEWIDLNK